MLKKITLIIVLIHPVFLFSEEVSVEFTNLSSALDTIWLIIAASLVFFMQAGFAMVETGLTRAKNSGNIIMKNVMDFAIGSLIFWAFGWGLMYGKDISGFIGSSSFFLITNNLGEYTQWLFQAVFAATAATIVSGAMAGRTKFSTYLIFTIFISGLIYPISGHWIWSENGWLNNLGFHDFAGSTVVHSVGGFAALIGAMLLGPRCGKYIHLNGKVGIKAIQGHNLPIAALGVFILWFGWYGFNAGSTLSGNDPAIGLIAVTTTLAAAAGAISSMCTTWILSKKPDVSMTLNGILAGLVAITAGCYVIEPYFAILVGFIAGVLVVVSVEFIDKKLHIDDPVGAISVHGICGVWGTLAVGLFASGRRSNIVGVFYNSSAGVKQLLVQLVGVLSVAAWALITCFILFSILKATLGLRVTEKEELIGLDIGEHGVEAYSGFQIFTSK